MDQVLLERLYVEEKKSYKEIATILGVATGTVYRWVSKFGLVGKRKAVEDLSGREFGSLTVLRYIRSGRYPTGGIYHVWECQCTCGRTIAVRAGNLKNGQKTCKVCATEVLAKKLTELPFDSKVWFGLVWRSRRKGIEVGITPEELYQVFLSQNGRCALTGVPIGFGKSTERGTTTASPDRVNPDEGYIMGNVRWVHKIVNSMRNTMDDDVFVAWCAKVVDFRKDTMSG